MDVVELAARIQSMEDDALDALVVERQVPAQLSSTFDLAEHLMTDASIAQALRWRSGPEVAALAAGSSTPRLDELLLGVDRAALPPVAAAAEQAIADRSAAAQLAEGRADARGIPRPRSPGMSAGPTTGPIDSPTAPQLAIDEAIKVAELVHRIADHPITLRSRAQLPAATARGLAAAIDAAPAQLDERLELAVLAGLVDRHDGRLRATIDADDWLASPVPDRWLSIASAWLRATPDARAVVAGDFPLADAAVRAVRERQARQATRLGLAEGSSVTTLAVALERDPAAARAALASHVPPATASVYLQPDLSAVAPGPLESAVDSRLRGIARIERAGIASQWRITAQSVTAGLAAGETADGMLEFLARISLTGVPQPVAYLVRDTAARFGSLRVRAVDPGGQGGPRSQARSSDEQLIRTIAVDRALSVLGPQPAGADRLTFRLSAEEALEALLEERYPAVLEDAEGQLMLRRPERAPRRGRERHRLVARLRDSGFEVGEQERAWLERQLVSAARDRMPVRLTVTTSGEPVDVELVPLAVANGRLRARDPHRDVERTLPLSAITRVAGLGAVGHRE